MATSIQNETAPYRIIQDVVSAEETAQAILQCKQVVFLVVLDLEHLGWATDEAATWVEQFHDTYQERSKHRTGPSLLVWKHKYSAADREVLHRSGAIPCDASSSHGRLNSLDAVVKSFVDSQVQMMQSNQWAESAVSQVPDADPNLYNSYPAGVSSTDVDKWIRTLNES